MMKFETGGQILLETGHGKVASKIIGWKEGAYFLVDAIDWRLHLKNGSNVVARAMSKGKYSGFTTEALGFLPEINSTILKFPDEIIESDIRKGERFPAVIPVKVGRNGGALAADGIVTDISGSGFKLKCDMAFTEAETIYVSGVMPTGEKLDRLAVTVKRMLEGEKTFDYGCECAEESPQAAAIAGYIGKISDYKEISDELKHPLVEGIPVGEHCQVQLGSYLKLPTIFRGVASNKYILIDPPTQEGKPIIAGRGEGIVILYMLDGGAYKFETQIVRQYTTPAPVWALNYPYLIKNRCLRKSTRMCALIPAWVESPGGAAEGAVLDISEGGGCFATAGHGFYKGERVTLRLTLPTGERLGGIHCEARNVSLREGKSVVGLAFEESDAAHIAGMIRNYCNLCEKAQE